MLAHLPLSSRGEGRLNGTALMALPLKNNFFVASLNYFDGSLIDSEKIDKASHGHHIDVYDVADMRLKMLAKQKITENPTACPRNRI